MRKEGEPTSLCWGRGGEEEGRLDLLLRGCLSLTLTLRKKGKRRASVDLFQRREGGSVYLAVGKGKKRPPLRGKGEKKKGGAF